MSKDEILKSILGQSGALVLACIALYYISQLYVDQMNTMMARCEDDRKIYHEQMLVISQKLEIISDDVKVIKGRE